MREIYHSRRTHPNYYVILAEQRKVVPHIRKELYQFYSRLQPKKVQESLECAEKVRSVFICLTLVRFNDGPDKETTARQ